MKTLVFDMDGTLADTYGVNGWLQMLRAEDPTPYEKATPLYDMMLLTAILWDWKCHSTENMCSRLHKVAAMVAATAWTSLR